MEATTYGKLTEEAAKTLCVRGIAPADNGTPCTLYKDMVYVCTYVCIYVRAVRYHLIS